jgi:hypothetical protein
MLRWGILATLVWHYTVDAFYTALLMLRSGNAYFVVSGSITAGIMLVPLVAALVLYWRRGGFEPEAPLLEAPRAVQPPAPVAVVAEAPVHATNGAPVPRQRFLVGAAVAVGLLLLYAVPVEEVGSGIEANSSRAEALNSARTHLRSLGADPAAWRTVMQMTSRYEPDAGAYILEHASLERLNAIYAMSIRTPVWRVRFYRPEWREEWILNLPVDAAGLDSINASDPVPPGSATNATPGAGSPQAGSNASTTPKKSPSLAGALLPLWAFEHVVPDSASGDTLGIDAAQLLASDFLRERGIEPADLDLKESRSERQKARTDHTFEWQVPDSTLGEAGIRYMVVVRGGEVAGLRPYIHLPEAWLRAYEERSVLQRILWVLSRGVLGVVVLGIVALFVLEVRAHRFPWSPALRWGAAGAVLSLVLVASHWQSDIVMRYETTMPYRLFLVGAAVSVVVQFLIVGILIAMLRRHDLRGATERARLVRGRHEPACRARCCIAGTHRRRLAGRGAATGSRPDVARIALGFHRRAAAAAGGGAAGSLARRVDRSAAQRTHALAGARAPRASGRQTLRHPPRRRLPRPRRLALRRRGRRVRRPSSGFSSPSAAPRPPFSCSCSGISSAATSWHTCCRSSPGAVWEPRRSGSCSRMRACA